MEQRLVGAEDVARALGVRVGTVRVWARRGLIPEVRLARNVRRFDLDEVLRTVKGKKGGGADA